MRHRVRPNGHPINNMVGTKLGCLTVCSMDILLHLLLDVNTLIVERVGRYLHINAHPSIFLTY